MEKKKGVTSMSAEVLFYHTKALISQVESEHSKLVNLSK